MNLRFETKILLSLFFLLITFLFMPVTYSQDRREYDEELRLDPACPSMDFSGLASVCGVVKNAPIERNMELGFDDTATPAEGITVAIYESDPESQTGKEFGELVHLFSSTSTNEYGRYHIPMRRGGPGLHEVYIAFLCNEGGVAGLKKVKSTKDIVMVDEFVNCKPNQEYMDPPQTLNYTDREAFLACSTITDADANSGVNSTMDVGYENNPSLGIKFDLAEDYYDGRYAPFNVNRIDERYPIASVYPKQNLPPPLEQSVHHAGAFWEFDCFIRWMSFESDPDRARHLCNIQDRMTNNWRADYLTRYFLDFLPERDFMPAWRAFEHRINIKQKNLSASAVTQYLQAMFGGYYGETYLKRHLSGAEDDLVPCSFLLESNNTVGSVSSTERNTRLNGGTASMLSHPGTWKEIHDTVEVRPGVPICKRGDETIVLKDIQPTWEYCEIGSPGCDYKLSKDYFRPEIILKKGSAWEGWTSQSLSDSYEGEFIRGSAFDLSYTELELPYKTGSKVAVPEGGKNKNASTVMAKRISSIDITDVGGILTNNLKSPNDEDDDFIRGQSVWDINNDNIGHCSLASATGHHYGKEVWPELERTEDALIVDNTFLGNPHHVQNNETIFGGNDTGLDGAGAGTGTLFPSQDALERDEELSNWDANYPFDPASGIPPLQWFGLTSFHRDLWDSIMTVASGDTTVNFSRLFGIMLELLFGNQDDIRKSFAQRKPDAGAPYAPGQVIEFTLSDESFNGVFPSIQEVGIDGLGPNDHADYQWRSVPVGEMCNVWPGPGRDPYANCYIDEIGTFCSDGGMRTCRIAQNVLAVSFYEEVSVPGEPEWRCMTEEECKLIGAWPDDCCYWYTPPPTTEPEVVTSYYFDGCSEEQKRQCLTDQESHDIFRRPPEVPTADNPRTEICNCSLEVAGPYEYVAPIEVVATGYAKQENIDIGNPDPQPELAMDDLNVSADMLARGFKSPVDKNKSYLKMGTMDLRSSNDTEAMGRYSDGEDVRAYGTGASPAINQIAASPTVTAPLLINDLEPLYYHCIDNNGIVNGDGIWECPVEEFTMFENACTGESFERIADMPDVGSLYYKARNEYNWFIRPQLEAHPELLEAYAYAESLTGVPCEILAGIHLNEGSMNPAQDLWEGSPIDPANLPEEAARAAAHLVGKLSKNIVDWDYYDYVKADDWYNGTGNENCYPPETPWCQGAEVPYIGWDHPHPMNWIDARHDNMYVKICADFALCGPPFTVIRQTTGVIPAAILVHQYVLETAP